jgi:hypothetical protein
MDDDVLKRIAELLAAAIIQRKLQK